MKPTKEIVFEFVESSIYKLNGQKKGIETKDVAEALSMQRSNVSSLLNELVKDGKLEKTATRPVFYTLPQNKFKSNESVFNNLVGHNGSIKKAIQLAQAAVLYPKKSLNVLLSSKNGCGTSAFVYSMYQFAIENGVLTEKSPYIKINCRHFSKNIEVLNDELFGVKSIEESAVYRAQGGMLFLDNVDFLDAKQQHKLFEFLDKGVLYCEQLKREIELKDVFLVISCSLALKEDYERRIPVSITLPELKDREIKERFDLVNYFFQKEALNSECIIEVSNEVLTALMTSDFSYNVKELEFEIKSACANAYVRSVNDLEKVLDVCLSDFKNKIAKNVFRMNEIDPEVAAILASTEKQVYASDFKMDKKDERGVDLYGEIKRQYDELAKRGINKESIQDVINTHIQILFKKYRYEKANKNQDVEQLSKIVDSRIIQIVSSFLDKYHDKTSGEIKRNVFYGLCLHINSLLTLSVGEHRINNEQVVKLIQDYPKEYAASVELSQELKEKLNLELPIEEITIIALFLIETEPNEKVGKPVLLYVLHGTNTASSLRDTTNALTHCQNAYCYDLTLETETKQALVELRELILKIDQGQGIFAIYDMGSIKTMLDTIAEEENVKIRYMNIPITLIGIDVARKCSMETDLEYVYHVANLEVNKMSRYTKRNRDAIITLCHTGDGGAQQLKNYISQYSRLGMRIIPLAISNKEELLKEILDLKKIYNIHAFVGTYDPKLLGIPFIPIDKILDVERSNLDRILMFEPVETIGTNFTKVYDYLQEQFKYTSISKLKSVLPEVVDELNVSFELSENQSVGLFMHIACLIERLLEGNIGHNKENPDKEKIINSFKEEYALLVRSLKKIEKKFNILINDNEVVTMLMIIKKL